MILRGAPTRGSSSRPSTPNSRNRAPPLTDSGASNVQLPRHLRVAHTLLTTQHDPSAHRHRLARLRPTRNQAQFAAILFADFQRFPGSSGTHIQVCSPPTYLCNVFITQDTSLRCWLDSNLVAGTEPYAQERRLSIDEIELVTPGVLEFIRCAFALREVVQSIYPAL